MGDLDRFAVRQRDLPAVGVTAKGHRKLVVPDIEQARRRVHEHDSYALRVAKRRRWIRLAGRVIVETAKADVLAGPWQSDASIRDRLNPRII